MSKKKNVKAEAIAARIIKKSNANLDNPHYHKWVVRQIAEHVAALEADRDRLQNELNEAKANIDTLTEEL